MTHHEEFEYYLLSSPGLIEFDIQVRKNAASTWREIRKKTGNKIDIPDVLRIPLGNMLMFRFFVPELQILFDNVNYQYNITHILEGYREFSK